MYFNKMDSKDASEILTLLRKAEEDFSIKLEILILALHILKQNPNLSILEAVRESYNEWIYE